MVELIVESVTVSISVVSDSVVMVRVEETKTVVVSLVSVVDETDTSVLEDIVELEGKAVVKVVKSVTLTSSVDIAVELVAEGSVDALEIPSDEEEVDESGVKSVVNVESVVDDSLEGVSLKSDVESDRSVGGEKLVDVGGRVSVIVVEK